MDLIGHSVNFKGWCCIEEGSIRKSKPVKTCSKHMQQCGIHRKPTVSDAETCEGKQQAKVQQTSK